MTKWLAETLRSHPNGTEPADFVLTNSPAGLTCVQGAHTDH